MSFIVNQSRELFKSLIINRRLIYTLTRREVISRYRGSVLGLLWSFLRQFLC